MHILLLEGDEQAGLLIVDGKIRSGTGMIARGVFVQQVIPGSPADQDGRLVHANKEGPAIINFFVTLCKPT